jgi:hypothetical protein
MGIPGQGRARGRSWLAAGWLLAGCLLAGVAAGVVAAAEVVVTVKQTAIRADRQFYAASLGTARFTERLEVLGSEQGWFKVRHAGVSGWVHGSAVGEGGGGASVAGTLGGIGDALGSLTGRPAQPAGKGHSEDEVALAGKGFNNEVEGQYRQRHPRANFAAVDRLEGLSAAPDEVRAFADEGKLLAAAGPVVQHREGAASGSLLDKAGSFFGGGKSGSSGDRKPQEFDPWAQ